MNLPNKLTVLRLIMVPIFMVVMLLPVFIDFHNETVNTVLNIVGVLLFIIASLTDMLDGKIARKHNLVTDFGKFMDPLADKFMVIGAMLCIFYSNSVAGNKAVATLYFITLIVVIFRELAVTSIRLVANSSSGVVIAANWMGKVKTVTQIIAVCSAIIEPMLWSLFGVGGFVEAFPPITFTTTVVTIYLTIHSGLNYIVGAWKYLDPEK
ncbi:MAG: CDP-diacylglycerol--glycerol-3-phosphate 3-phosphatidyltransferase [Clostridia bacterium]|nr:CDP-diacylglycerol--glycerol-3-phosphate 3-phosphatidyltransferase [Clostridia bacterium]